ncbi:hypothetical protein [Klebsiella quasipneumoniae]|uniref:hypothetical protein n=1 Tax=Klebsiella quasipneumoniae TaxID=1463165 RepID=UPI00296FC70F|nr:hypothetical protein [Klebsiella quasipneumoniae]
MLNYRSYFTQVDVDKYSVNVTLPVSPYRDIFHSSSIVTGTQFRNKLSALLKTPIRLLMKSKSQNSASLRNAFGEDFPECAETSSASSNAVKTVFASAGVGDIARRMNYSVIMAHLNECGYKVSAIPSKTAEIGFLTVELEINGMPVTLAYRCY